MTEFSIWKSHFYSVPCPVFSFQIQTNQIGDIEVFCAKIRVHEGAYLKGKVFRYAPFAAYIKFKEIIA
jgi:hypothetical protein